MIQSKSLGSKIFNVFNIILMSLLSLSCLYPLWYTLCLSVSDKAAANSGKVSFYPVGFSLASYQQIMGDTQFFRSFLISAERTIFGTVFTIVVLAIFAYPLSKSANEYHPKNVIMWIVIFCMLFNGGTIPWYITMVNYGMIDSMIGLILCGGLPVFNLILLINFYRSLPKELMEAAEIDGATGIKCFFNITIPLLSPTIFFVMITRIIGSLQIFDLIYMVMEKSNPALEKTQSLVFLFYKYSFTNKNVGYGSTIVILLLIITLIITAIQMAAQKKWVFYN